MFQKIAIVYPPFANNGFPHLGQNRWFHYSYSRAAKIHPIVPSITATLLRNNGYEALYLDGINEELSFSQFMKRFYDFDSEIVILETKTPVIRTHWEFINTIKVNKRIKIILVGDHVSFFPEESFKNSLVDYCVTGGDYDITILKLLEFLNGKSAIPKGVWYRNNGKVLNTGRFELIKQLDTLPFIDRELTNWKIYGEAYLHRPCAYIMSGRGCGTNNGMRGRCKFCSWQYALWDCTARLRSPQNVAEEINILVKRYKIKEIFDDNESGAIYNKEWLKQFYEEMKAYKLLGKVCISSNARADVLNIDICKLLKKIGFRLLKVGLESASNETLMRLNKQETIAEIEEGVKNAKDHGLTIMLTIMIGYPWENEEVVRQTYEVVKKMLFYKTRVGDALQVSLIIPYPGTPLYFESLKNNWFTVNHNDYDKYGMSQPILNNNINTALWGRRMWHIYWNPKYLFKSLLTLRSYKDFLLVWRGMRSLVKHISEWR